MRLSKFFVVVLIGLGGCSSPDQKRGETPELSGPMLGHGNGPNYRRTNVPEGDDEGNDDVQLKGAKGNMETYDARTAIENHSAAIQKCFLDQVSQSRYLGGKVELKIFVAEDGTVSGVRMLESELGTWEVESCLINEVKSIVFAKPKGGATDMRLPIEFPAYQDSQWLHQDELTPMLKPLWATLKPCKKAPKRAKLTFYVASGGTVSHVGFSSKDKIHPAWADCVSQTMKAWKLTDPQGVVTKTVVGFRR